MVSVGKMLLIVAGILAIVGLVAFIGGKTGFMGKLPGDVFIQKGNFSFYFPLGSSLILSAVLSIIGIILTRLLK